MKIHSDSLTYSYFFAAQETARIYSGAPVWFHGEETLPRRGSRCRRYSWDVKLASDGTLSRRRVNYGTAQYVDRFDRPYAATWDQWGWFLAHLFTVDPAMIVPHVYADAADFHEKTKGRYARNLTTA